MTFSGGIDAFFCEPATAEEIRHKLLSHTDLYDPADRGILLAAFEAFLPENASWDSDELDHIKLTKTAAGLDLMLKLGGASLSPLHKGRILYLRGTMAMLLGDSQHALAMLWSSVKVLPATEGRYRAATLFQLADLLVAEGIEDYQGIPVPEVYQRALGSFDLEQDPHLHGQIQQAIGTWYLEQGAGYRDEVLQKGLTALHASVRAFESVSMGGDAATSKVYISFAYSELHGGDQNNRCELAIKFATEALQILRRSDDPFLWASAQTALGSAYWERVSGRRQDNLDRSAKAHRAALRVYQPEVNAHARAQSLVNLASVAIQQTQFDPIFAPEKAIDFCRRALKLCDKTAPDEIVLTALMDLSTALSERKKGRVRRNYSQAEEALNQAIEFALSISHPLLPLLQLNKAVILIELDREYGFDRLDEAQAILVELAPAFNPNHSPENWLRYQRHVALIAGLQDRWADLSDVAARVFENVTKLRQSANSFDEQRRLVSDISDICDLGVLAVALEKGPDAAIKTALKYQDTLFGDVQKRSVILENGQAELFCFTTLVSETALTIIRHPGGSQLVLLPKLGFDFWAKFVQDPTFGFIARRSDFLQTRQIGSLVSFVREWVDSISDGCGPLFDALENLQIREVSVHAHSSWALVPFSAIAEKNDHRPTGPVFFTNGFPTKNPVGVEAETPFWHVRNRSLLQASAETKFLQQRFENFSSLQSLNALKNNLIKERVSGVLHFTCHGRYDFAHMDDGGIEVPKGGVLSARWVYENARLKPGSTVVMAACETGISDFQRLPNEGFGLPRAFLKAGAGSVISTLWPVHDLATRIFVESFYKNLLSGETISGSFQTAQNYLRLASADDIDSHLRGGVFRMTEEDDDGPPLDEFPFAHPFYWAGFILHQG